MRPQTLDQVVGQHHLVAKGAPLRQMIEQDRLRSAILWGPPGTGKTTIARVIANTTSSEFVMLHAATSGVKELREVVAAAEERLGIQQRGTVVFIDELFRWTKSQITSLLEPTESGIICLVGATTESPWFEINSALLSRSTIYKLDPLEEEDIAEVIRRALGILGASATNETVDQIVHMASGDARQAIGLVELVYAVAVGRCGAGPVVLEPTDVERSGAAKVYRYNTDEHYTLARAIIQSISAGDVQASCYYCVRCERSGMDMKFLARRLVIEAAEEIGMADPRALQIAVANFEALDRVGLPEAMIPMMQTVIYLARAPKSNSVLQALHKASAIVDHSPAYQMPAHLRVVDESAGPQAGVMASKLQMNRHEHASDNARRQYLPDELVGTVFYEPSENDKL